MHFRAGVLMKVNLMYRRQFLQCGSAVLATPWVAKAQAADLPITVSSYLLDRTAALFDGRVQIAGTTATFVQDAIGDMNTRAFSGNGDREITELGLHPFMLAHANEGFRDYSLIPAFPIALECP